MPMLEAAKAAMPSIAITEEQARDLRFGRRIEVHVRIDAPTAAYVQTSGEVIAILEPAGDADAGTAKPVAVFPAD